jgi:hypothetical protein
MRLIYIFLVSYAIIGCTLEPKTPCVCQRNLQDCLDSYDGSMSRSKWDDLCREDINVCQSNHGM